MFKVVLLFCLVLFGYCQEIPSSETVHCLENETVFGNGAVLENVICLKTERDPRCDELKCEGCIGRGGACRANDRTEKECEGLSGAVWCGPKECTWDYSNEFCTHSDSGKTKSLETLPGLENCFAAVRHDSECGDRFKYNNAVCACLKQGEVCTTEALSAGEVAFELDCNKQADSVCSEYSQERSNARFRLVVGEPNERGFEFTASNSGVLHTLRLSLAARYTQDPYKSVEVDGDEVGEVWIAIYKGRGFGSLMRKQKFTAGAKTSCVSRDECALHDYTFSKPIYVNETETYTVGLSLVAAPDNEYVSAEGGYDFYQYQATSLPEESKRNAWYLDGNRNRWQMGFSAYFGTRICPPAECSLESVEAAQNWDILVDVLSGSLGLLSGIRNVNDVFEAFWNAMNTGEILNLNP